MFCRKIIRPSREGFLAETFKRYLSCIYIKKDVQNNKKGLLFCVIFQKADVTERIYKYVANIIAFNFQRNKFYWF